MEVDLEWNSAAHNVNSAYQDAYFQFTLAHSQLDQINRSPRINVYGTNGSIVDKTHQIQVQMRFCLAETSCEQLDNYPPYINVRVNGKAVELPVRIFGCFHHFKTGFLRKLGFCFSRFCPRAKLVSLRSEAQNL